MPPWTVGRVLALIVLVVCLVLVILALASVGSAIPAWIVFVLIGVLALAILI